MRASSAVALVLLLGATPAAAAPKGGGDTAMGDYFQALEKAGLLDVDTGTQDTLKAELGVAERLLAEGSPMEAAVVLYGIVESPRYAAFTDFVEFGNAEYDLAVALGAAGAYDSALEYLVRAMERGPSSLYWAPAHRRAVDIALETRRFAEVLDLLVGVKTSEPIPPGAAGERAYLRAEIAYGQGKLDEAEALLTPISRKSRLYSSALYLRSLIRTRRGQFTGAAEALCEIVDTPDNDKFTFVIDDRYFRIKDLARLGLGRLAHEKSEYDDAYYHYFQIPDDSDRLPEALFEAAWSMYQKRELGTARDLTAELIKDFPDSPLTPEARLLAGYVELADCEFDKAQRYYDQLVVDLQPVVDAIDRIRKSPDARAALYARALARDRAERADPSKRLGGKPVAVEDQVLALLRVDPEYVKLHEALAGLRTAAGDAPHVVRAWTSLARTMSRAKVGTVGKEKTVAEEDLADANGLLEDVDRLAEQVDRARAELRRGVRDKTLTADAAADEDKRLEELARQVTALREQSAHAADAAADAVTGGAEGGLTAMVRADLKHARELQAASGALVVQLTDAADAIARRSLDKLWKDTRRVLDKAKLGKIDAVIGQKRRLDIEVRDLAAGRFPQELYGKLWEQGMIGDDEEFWPFEGEYWSDEYKDWR
ncbi:MAG TPA: tetratricopeptide repeat protein [Kofleriaceae bacterium]|nr:tetratricopeptide repeat protein [Kofleriaceae bacterium]